MEHHGFHFFKLKRCTKGSIHFLVCLGNFCIHKFLEISPSIPVWLSLNFRQKRLLMGVGGKPLGGWGGWGGGQGQHFIFIGVIHFIFIYLKSPVFHILQSTFYFTGVELTVAQGLMKRMQNEGFLRQAAKGKRYACVFNFTYIAMMMFEIIRFRLRRYTYIGTLVIPWWHTKVYLIYKGNIINYINSIHFKGLFDMWADLLLIFPPLI